MQIVVKARAHLHRSSIVVLFGPHALRTDFFVQQHAKLRLGIYEQKLRVGRTGRDGEVRRCGCRIALRLRDRLADRAVRFPG